MSEGSRAGSVAALSPAKQRLLDLMLQEKRAAKVMARQDVVTGEVAITPPQAHEFELVNPDRHMFNLPLLLEVHLPLTPGMLEQIVGALIRHHDSLRICSFQEGGEWKQRIADLPASSPVSYIDLRALPDAAARRAEIESRVDALQRSFDLAAGPLFKAAYFDLGPGEPARLLLVTHHIACDHHSSTVLAEDFITAYQQLRAGQAIHLPPKTVSYLDWSNRLARSASSQSLLKDLPYWRERLAGDVHRIPLDHPEGSNVGSAWKVLARTFDLGRTPHLAHAHLKAHGAQLHHALIAAAASALNDWTGGGRALISMCHHGRLHPFKELDISRTTGWFSYQYPLAIDLTGASDAVVQLRRAREQIDGVPSQGLSYGVLRYMGGAAVKAQLAALPEPEVFLNLRVGTHMEIPGFAPAQERCGDGGSPSIVRTRHLYLNLDLNEPQLTFNCLYNPLTHDESTLDRFVHRFTGYLGALDRALRSSLSERREGE